MTKPVGPICNLDCAYCYYLEKEELYPPGTSFRMGEGLLEHYIRQYIEASPGPVVEFVWQGGEPTLLGLPFFQRIVELQQRFLPPGWQVSNSIQTNGLQLDEAWCRFLREESFLVGLSVDGPAEQHDPYRVDKGGRPTHARVIEGLRLLQRHGVEYNLLCVVHAGNVSHPLEVYRFFKQAGAAWVQFIPLVEHLGEGQVSERSVAAADYGRFLTVIFDEWIRHDVGRIYVQLFEECLKVWAGFEAGLCIFAETCGRALALEHNGDLYSCDHYVNPEHRLGNIALVPLAELADSPEQVRFGLGKRDSLPQYCQDCDVRFMCNGGCPRERFINTPDGAPGLNYLCAGYKQIFRHMDPYMRRMAELWRVGQHPERIMAEL